MSGKYNLAGKRFGRLKVIKENGRGSSGAVAWLCECECGNQVTVEGHALVRGKNKSCGCLHGENHGFSDDRLYAVWQTMKRRCDLPTNEKYPAYGGRGITVCEEWANSFKAFREWALSNGYDYNGDESTYMVESSLGQCICDTCAVQCIHLMLNHAKGQ